MPGCLSDTFHLRTFPVAQISSKHTRRRINWIGCKRKRQQENFSFGILSGSTEKYHDKPQSEWSKTKFDVGTNKTNCTATVHDTSCRQRTILNAHRDAGVTPSAIVVLQNRLIHCD